jgi:nucleotidyltransferase/DNA polymerase involved in DNA repair
MAFPIVDTQLNANLQDIVYPTSWYIIRSHAEHADRIANAQRDILFSMQQFQHRSPTTEHSNHNHTLPTNDEPQAGVAGSANTDEATRAIERTRMRQGVMHVRIDHFYCTLEEMIDPSLTGQSFIVGTGTGRPNEPGRVIDVSPAAARLGLQPGMPLRRAHRIAPRTRFLAASYDHYQPLLQKLKERYRAYSRIIESIPISDAFIDLRGSELKFDSPVTVAEKLCREIEGLGLHAMIGIANGKTIAELTALMSRRDGRQGVLYVPAGREASFVQSLPLAMLLKLRATGMGVQDSWHDDNGSSKQDSEIEGRQNPHGQIDPIALAELVAHLKDFGITNFVQVAALTEDGLVRRLGTIGGWLYHLAHGEDESLVIPDAPPQSQNARIRFQHQADADECCSAIRRLSDYVGERLQEQRLKGRSIALILWPYRLHRETRRLHMGEDGEEVAVSATEETIGGQMLLERHTNKADIIAHHALMLFAHYHRAGTRYTQVQLRVSDMITSIPNTYYPPSALSRARLTRKL